MRSLRSRLILGAALVALVPLVAVMLVLSARIERMVREDAEQRLRMTLQSVRADLGREGRELEAKLRILSRDPALRRLYLVEQPHRELWTYLAERRVLLGLDFLEVADAKGMVIAEGTQGGWLGGLMDSSSVLQPAPGDSSGVAVTELKGGEGLALSATGPILYQGERVGTVHGGIRLDTSYLDRLQASGVVEFVLADPSRHVMASTFSLADSSAVVWEEPIPPALMNLRPPNVRDITMDGTTYLGLCLPIEIGMPPFARLTGLVSTAPADRAIAALRATSALLALLGIGLAVGLGFLWSAQISRPVERLAMFSQRVARGEWDEPLSLQSVRELETLVDALDRMRRDLVTYRDRLVVSERQAAWSQMARRVAHEIKNPLTPIAVSVSDLRRSYEQKREDFPAILDQATRTISEEVETMKHLLQEFSDYGRLPEPRMAPCRLSDLWVDLRTLYGPEIEESRLVVSELNGDGAGFDFSADAGQIRQAMVNLIKNGLEAIGAEGQVSVAAAQDEADLSISVSDTGPGMTPEQRQQLFMPGFTTKAEGSGLGLAIVERIVSDHGGTIGVESQPGTGTTFRLRLPKSRRI